MYQMTTDPLDPVMSPQPQQVYYSSVWDPLKFASPVIAFGSSPLQDVVRLKPIWDDAVPPDLEYKLESHWRTTDYKIPRCVKPSNVIDATIQLYNFFDASYFIHAICVWIHCTIRLREIVQLRSIVFTCPEQWKSRWKHMTSITESALTRDFDPGAMDMYKYLQGLQFIRI